MTAHLGRGSATAEHDGIELLVEAERAWQQSLDAARAEGERFVAAAEALAAEAERAFEASIPELIADRRRTTQTSIEADARALGDDLAHRARRYMTASDTLVQELAQQVAARAPWVCAPEDRGER
jgi:hypothetical protein